MKKIKSFSQKTRKVRVFVWKGIHCRVKFIVTLKIQMVQTLTGIEVTVTVSGGFHLKATPKLVRKRGKVYLSSKHQNRGDLGGMRYPNRVLGKYLLLCTCNYRFIVLTRV